MSLEIIVTVLSFIHKIFLLKQDRKIAWSIGIIASLLSIYYFYTIHLSVYVGLEIGLSILMLYGLFMIKSKKVEDLINIFTGIFCILIAYWSFIGLLTIYELISSITALLGIYFLTHKKDKIGWIFWIATYIVTMYVVFQKGQLLFFIYQFFSLILAIYALKKSYSLKIP